MRARVASSDELLSRYLSARFPQNFPTPEEAAAIVRQARARAERYGVVRDDDLATFLDLSVLYGDRFDSADWACDVLSCDRLHGPDKMAILRDRVRSSGVAL